MRINTLVCLNRFLTLFLNIRMVRYSDPNIYLNFIFIFCSISIHTGMFNKESFLKHEYFNKYITSKIG